MMEENRGSEDRDSGGPSAAGIVRSLVKDLAELAQAQASLTRDMVRLLDLLNEEKPQPPREEKREVVGAAPPATVEAVPPAPVPAPAPVAVVSAAPPAPAPVAPVPAAPPAPSAPEPVEYAVASDEEGLAALSVTAGPVGEHADDSADLVSEGPDEMEGTEAPDATVLVLESGDARVGVLWDQVVQVGSLTASIVPPRIETERGQTNLVSLGLLLHGVSREEKYFVVLEEEGDRAAVACERMLGLGPLNSASKDDTETRIQVLRVPLLKTFAKGAQVGASRGHHVRPGGFGSRPDEEERDRNGPLRALVAVRYLPARVAICRHLRGCGWQVGEAAGLEAANISLDLGRWDVLFLEVRSNGEVDETETTILKRVAERGIPVIRVGSRISGFPQQEGPSVMFPFPEAELDAILVQVGERANRK